MRLLIKYILRFPLDVVALMLLYLAQSVCSLFLPSIMRNIVETGIRNGDIPYILTQGAIMVALALAALGCSVFTNKITSGLMPKFSGRLRKEVFEKVNSLSFEQFNQLGTGSLITRVTQDISWLEDSAVQLPFVVVMVPTMFIGGVVMTFFWDAVLALILLAVSPIVLFLVWRITRGMFARWQHADKYSDLQNKIVRERLSGARVVRAFNKDQEEHQRSESAIKIMCRNFVKNNTIGGIISPLTMMLLNIVTVVIIFVGTQRLQMVNGIKAGNIIAVIQYISLIANAILIMSWTLAFVPHVKVCMGRVDEVLKMPLTEDQDFEEKQLLGDLTFENVSFVYPKAQSNALSNINLDIKQGEIVGIIGGTGSGKSTLIKLILNFYGVSEGKRNLGGIDYDAVSPATIRQSISIALQKSMIFEGTIEENIKMGNKDATAEQVNKTIEIAQLTEFVADHQEGINYQLNQSGSNASGGQKQRINIARAILKPASIYIFDDSFSALDFLTERNLRKALNKYIEGKTQIIVTQRAATAMRCDKVYVLDQGKIVGFGTHKQLLDTCNIYREIYDSQLGGDGHGEN